MRPQEIAPERAFAGKEGNTIIARTEGTRGRIGVSLCRDTNPDGADHSSYTTGPRASRQLG